MRFREWVIAAMAVLSLSGMAFGENVAPNEWVPGARLVVFEEFSRAT